MEYSTKEFRLHLQGSRLLIRSGLRINVGFLAIFMSSCLAASTVADTIDFGTETAIATFRSEGLVTLDGLGSWNGQPVSETNMPSESQRRLSATFDLFADEASTQHVWLRVSGVVSTQGASWFGGAFVNTILTSIDLDLRTSSASVGILGGDFGNANPGQSLLGNETGSVTETIGWVLSGDRLRTESNYQYGFAEYASVTGAVIQEGGGLFRLALGRSVGDISWSQSGLTAGYGVGNQYIESELLYSNAPVPALPAGLVLAGAGLFTCGRRRR
jgi:hypothetical protein